MFHQWLDSRGLLSEKHRIRKMDIPDLRLETTRDHGTNIDQIDYIEEPITYQKFFTEYLLRNKPCVLGSWATDSWRNRAEWVKNNEPNLDYLVEKFGK